MTFVVEVETNGRKRTVGKPTGETVFSTKVQAESIAHMFSHTVDGCTASVAKREEPSPWAGSVSSPGAARRGAA